MCIVCIVYDSLYDTRQALLRLPEQSVGLATLAVREELCFAIKNTDDCKRLGLTPPPVREDLQAIEEQFKSLLDQLTVF